MNSIIDIHKRKEKLEGVAKVISACSGVSEGLDNLAQEVLTELRWYLNQG
jgi:hypothetical protein